MPEKLLKGLKNALKCFSEVALETKGDESFKTSSSLIPRISVFDTPQKANVMRFYAANDWEKMSDEEKQSYKAKEEERKAIIKEVKIETKIADALREL